MPPAFDPASAESLEVYDDLPLWSSAPGRMLLDAVELRPTTKLLDLGCGAGFPLVELAERIGPRGEAHGVDVWTAALDRARKKIARRGVANAFVHETDAGKLPFADGFFDVVVSNLGVNNFADPPHVLAETRRVCRDGARLVVATNVVGTMSAVYDALLDAMTAIGATDASARVEKLVRARATAESLTKLLEDARFAVRDVKREETAMRFACGDAVLAHSFVRLGFVDAWTSTVDAADRGRLLVELARRLDLRRGDAPISLAVPLVCVDARAA